MPNISFLTKEHVATATLLAVEDKILPLGKNIGYWKKNISSSILQELVQLQQLCI